MRSVFAGNTLIAPEGAHPNIVLRAAFTLAICLAPVTGAAARDPVHVAVEACANPGLDFDALFTVLSDAAWRGLTAEDAAELGRLNTDRRVAFEVSYFSVPVAEAGEDAIGKVVQAMWIHGWHPYQRDLADKQVGTARTGAAIHLTTGPDFVTALDMGSKITCNLVSSRYVEYPADWQLSEQHGTDGPPEYRVAACMYAEARDTAANTMTSISATRYAPEMLERFLRQPVALKTEIVVWRGAAE